MIAVMPLSTRFGWRVLGLGVIALGGVALLLGDFLPGQPAPKALPARGVLAVAAGAVMTAAGAGLMLRRTARWAAVVALGYFALVVVMNGGVLVRHLGQYGAYSGAAEQLAMALGALLVFAQAGEPSSRSASRLVRPGQLAFGGCVLLFGGAHFVYMNLTAPLVPKWAPPSQVFWGYATGVAQIAAAAAILSGIRRRLAAILLTAMYAAFTPLVHLPMLLGAPADHFVWSENALNLALTGAAWVVADSCGAAPDRAGAAREPDRTPEAG